PQVGRFESGAQSMEALAWYVLDAAPRRESTEGELMRPFTILGSGSARTALGFLAAAAVFTNCNGDDDDTGAAATSTSVGGTLSTGGSGGTGGVGGTGGTGGSGG